MWSLCDKGLCPGWRVQIAAVSGDQPPWKDFKRLFHPCFGSVSDESGMRNRIPHIPGSWISWEKAYVQYGLWWRSLWKASAAFFFFSLAPQGLSLCCVMRAGRVRGRGGVGSRKRQGLGWSGLDTREHADIHKVYLSLLGPEATQTQQCSLWLRFISYHP